MLRKVLVGKLHRATITGADLSYMGSITIDPVLLEAAGIAPLQEVEIWNINNGERLTTYALPGKRDSGEVVLNGAAARKAEKGDIVVIAAYGLVDPHNMDEVNARVVMVGQDNRIDRLMEYHYTLYYGAPGSEQGRFELRELK